MRGPLLADLPAAGPLQGLPAQRGGVAAALSERAEGPAKAADFKHEQKVLSPTNICITHRLHVWNTCLH